MTRCGVVLLVAITLAWGEDKGAEYNALLALDDFRLARQGKEVDYKALRERIGTNLPKATRATQWVVLREVNKAIDRKVGPVTDFHLLCVRVLADYGDDGLEILAKRIRSRSKRHDLRRAIAIALGETSHPKALELLFELAQNRETSVAAEGVRCCAPYARLNEAKHRDIVEWLIDLYAGVSSAAAGRKPDSKQVKRLAALAPVLDGTLRTLTGTAKVEGLKGWQWWFKRNPSGRTPVETPEQTIARLKAENEKLRKRIEELERTLREKGVEAPAGSN